VANGVPDMIQELPAAVTQMAPGEVKEGLHGGDVALVVDVREPEEFGGGSYSNVVAMPAGTNGWQEAGLPLE
jgi:rhodanese-related sulfurtransferase